MANPDADSPNEVWENQGWYAGDYHPGYDTRAEYLDRVIDDFLDEFEFSPYE